MRNLSFKTKSGTVLQLIDLKGRDYLQVAQRVLWFREEHPSWTIQTEFVLLGDKSAVAKATISDEKGRVVSTSHKCEDKLGFMDFAEKAETGAIGRALALIGYGTQFCADELDEGARIVDSPIGKPNAHAPSNMQPPETDGAGIDKGYRIPFGKYSKRSIEEVDVKELENYAIWLEGQPTKTGKPNGAAQVEFLQRVWSYFGAMETGNNDKALG